ncbi:ABC transporter G family member 3 [Olea europaea var. sylvestris]|uniref:ABC transporter G family member 3 n=1 Tax=Olea europaea var. sylvestris TaxID=158386 RepID=UPI000C1D5EBD|nr:ABC transporter G family member 3 [Olea europaea var. sylvestris]
MEEIHSQSDHYRSSSSSASSPASRVPSSNFFYLRKPGALRQPISFEDSPDWDDTDIEVKVEEGGGDSINAATTPASPSLSKINSGSLPSPPLPEGAVVARKIAGASVAWKDLTITIKGKRKYSDKVVKSSNGYALPGTMTVIMGPAKSGKSTLLRALAGRLPDSARMYGEVHINGVKSHMPYGSYYYVLDKLQTRVAAIFVFISFSSILSIAGVPAQLKEIKIYACEQSNWHSGTLVFLLGQLLSSIPFVFLISISSSLVFYFLVGLRDHFSLLMYFVLNFFACLLVNEGLVLVIASICQDIFWSILILLNVHVIMMLSAGYFRIRSALPKPVWMYPVSYIAFHTYAVQGLLENEYIGTSFAVGQVRTISGYQALRNVYDISQDSNARWENLLVLFLMAVGYRILVFVLLKFRVRNTISVRGFLQCSKKTKNPR